MKVLLTVTAAAGFLALSLPAATPAMATEGCMFYPYIGWVCPPEPEVPEEPECDCVSDAVDILQNLTASQTATNVIDDFKTVTNVVQTATNIGNSVNIDAELEVIPDLSSITQNATGFQSALNYLEFGGGGYTGPAFTYDEDGDFDGDYTQAALNAVNLVNVPALGRPTLQTNTTTQTAINTATFQGETYFPFWYGDVSYLSQSATNVANSISAAEFGTFDECGCIEIDQMSDSWQYASNTISGASSWDFGSLNDAIQNATNIANSINGSLPETD